MKSNILVVDDEPVARQSLSDILRLEGYTVNSVPNGQAAVEYVRTHPVDLMIVDLRMPGMDGLEVIQVVNQVSPETEVILLTAFGTTESAIQALRLRDPRLSSQACARPHRWSPVSKRDWPGATPRLKDARRFGSTMDVEEGAA